MLGGEVSICGVACDGEGAGAEDFSNSVWGIIAEKCCSLAAAGLLWLTALGNDVPPSALCVCSELTVT